MRTEEWDYVYACQESQRQKQITLPDPALFARLTLNMICTRPLLNQGGFQYTVIPPTEQESVRAGAVHHAGPRSLAALCARAQLRIIHSTKHMSCTTPHQADTLRALASIIARLPVELLYTHLRPTQGDPSLLPLL